jgi:hypothetical protein
VTRTPAQARLHGQPATGSTNHAEAAAGRPLVVAAHGCGRVVAAGDVAAWARAIGDIAADPQQLAAWRARVPLPQRIEEEGFLYTELYRAAAAPTD